MSGFDFVREKVFWKENMKQRALKRLARKPRSVWFRPGRSDTWWTNIINGIAPPDEWKKNFCLSEEQFRELAEKLRPYISPNSRSPNYRAIDAEKKLAVTLYYLKDKGSLRMTANAFGIQVCTASKIIHQVCREIAMKLGPELIRLPQNKEEMMEKASEFEVKFGMPQAFGCIDGTHIQLKRPIKNSQDYFCYKMYFSLNVQAICDCKGLFMDIDCRWPGSVHDAKVFANSRLNQKMALGHLPITYQQILPGRMDIPNYLIGDPAYPLVPFCMKEYEKWTKNSEVIFNNLLRTSRNPVECAFGRLKARWGFLASKVDLKLELVPIVAYACFVLHNYCEVNHGGVDIGLVNQQKAKHIYDDKQQRTRGDPVYSGNTDEGLTIREIITSYIEENIPNHLLG